MNYRLLLSIFISLGVGHTAYAQTLKDSVLINFRQSKVDVDSNYMNNREAFRHIENSMEEYHRPDFNFGLKDVKVVGGASPEGSVKFNNWLSGQRAERIFDYMSSHINLPDSLTTHTMLGRDWEGLRAMVIADPQVPNREEVIETISHIIDAAKERGYETDADLQQLKQLQNGVPYLYLYRHLFPSLRESRVVLTFGALQRSVPAFMVPEIPADLYTVTDIVMPPFVSLPAPKQSKPFYMALKTNMLLDILAVPEGGIEFYLGKNLSIVGNWEYGWWDNDREHRYWRMYGGDLALRWWFGSAAHRKPLTGHHIGIYGGVVTYDFEFGGKGYMGGLPGRPLWDRCNWYCGVEYGYSLPIARRLNLDFTLGLGYLTGKYIEYEPMGRCYVWEATKKKHWYGPTKLEVSLVWLLGRGNFNAKKGGAR